MLRLFRIFFAFLCCSVAALAQSVRWEPAGGSIPRDQTSSLALVFENCEPSDAPALPTVAGLDFGKPSRSENSSFNITLGAKAVSNRSITYNYPVTPRVQDGEVRIPAFTIKTDAGPLSVPAAGFRIVPATLGQTGLTVDEIVKARIIPPADPVWAGEVFPLRHTLEIAANRAYQSSPTLEWTGVPISLEEWSAPKQAATASVKFETRTTRALAPSSGSVTLPPATLVVGIATGTDLFGRPIGDRYNINTAPVTLSVRPLPSPSPADFSGAVGQFTLESKAIPSTAAVGEPITWTLTLSGTGNWPALNRLPPRSLSRDFRVITPRAQKTPKDNALFDAALAEDLVLIPQKAGPATLPALTLSFFDPRTGTYETLRTEPITLTITPAVANANSAIPQTQPSAGSNDTGSATPPPAAALLAPPSPLPGDPLPAFSTPSVSTPIAPRTILIAALLPLLIPLAAWLLFAARRARLLDPVRPRREAHSRLAALINQLEAASVSATTDTTAGLLLRWQQELRTLLSLPATPTSRDLPDPVWAALWIETERVLYRPATTLSPEWFAQARNALARATPPAFRTLSLFRPAHLFVRATLWLLILHSTFVISHSSFAASAAESYAAGDFTTAAKLWREQLAAAPADSALHHNLALALAQQNAWDEAAAHAALSALHAPRAEAPRRLLALALPNATYRPAFAELFPSPRPSGMALLRHPATFAGLLSPRAWQLIVVATSLLVALAITARLAAAYGTSPRLLRPLGNTGLLLALFALAASLFALRIYAPMLPGDTVLVWQNTTLRSVPTEAGEPQKTTTLAAGTLARTDKSFLGWRRLILPDGTTGWTRTTPLLPLWPEPPAATP